MKTQILRFSPLQSAKVMAVLSFMMLVPPLAPADGAGMAQV